MQTANNLSEYSKQLDEAIDDSFLRKALDNFARAYPQGRSKAFAGMDADALFQAIADKKDETVARLDEVYAQFKERAEAAGVHVHYAHTDVEANEIIADIGKKAGVKRVVKSKSMTAEEIHINDHLEAEGFEVVETDLGEWIIQLRQEPPSHMVMPAIHLSREQVADLFGTVTGKPQDVDVDKLVKVARRELRQRYVEADMGISGANFAIAETGTIGLVTNEGNARLVTTWPRVHVALCGIEKLTPTLADAMRIVRALPKNATGQIVTSYITWITGANECFAEMADGTKEMHIVFMDNGRTTLAADEEFKQVLRCIRCGACANVCPVYRMVGGHKYGHVYIGAIGLILTYFFHGSDKAKQLVQNCINCQACKAVCAAKIDLPRLIKDIHARIQDEDGHPIESQLLAITLKNRRLFHGLLRAASKLQIPFTEQKDDTRYIRHLPLLFLKDQKFRALPTVANTPFRDQFKDIAPKPTETKLKVALFAGCAQDFLYPEQLEAAVRTISELSGNTVEFHFPDAQSCCGLPVQMMGEKDAAVEVAGQNVEAFKGDNPHGNEYDYIITLCASCSGHIKEAYPRLLAGNPHLRGHVANFTDKVINYADFVKNVLGVDAAAFGNTTDGPLVATHTPCHLCRGPGDESAPAELAVSAGCSVQTYGEEQVCCGFGGSYSVKFPQISRELVSNKIDQVEKTGASVLITDCPGCVMQLRGRAVRAGAPVEVKHTSELIAERLEAGRKRPGKNEAHNKND